MVQSQPRQCSQNPSSKIIRTKWTRDVAQGIECLLCKFKPLSSNLSAKKKKKRFLACFQVLAIMSKTAINIGVQVVGLYE
jgi:hypothetical protein